MKGPEASPSNTAERKARFGLTKEKKPLNHPIENQFLQRYGNKTFRVGIASMQGKRETMEDAHSALLELKQHPNVAFFGVFDGHNGSIASRWCAENIYSGIDQLSEITATEIEKKMIELDQQFLKEKNDMNNGSTAVFALVQKSDQCPSPDKPYKVTIANLGDSRCIIGRPKTRQVEVMTEDHKPSNPIEEQRITAAQGFVARGRLDANLAVARAIGDHSYKSDPALPPAQQKIIPVPDITEGWIGPDDFLFICCDGIFETFNNEQVMEFLFYRMDKADDSAHILSDLLYEVLERGSKDNMSAMIVEIKDGSEVASKEEFVVGQYYENGNDWWMKAYKSNLDHHKITLDQAKKMWEDRKVQALDEKERRSKLREKKFEKKEKKKDKNGNDCEGSGDSSEDSDVEISEEPITMKPAAKRAGNLNAITTASSPVLSSTPASVPGQKKFAGWAKKDSVSPSTTTTNTTPSTTSTSTSGTTTIPIITTTTTTSTTTTTTAILPLSLSKPIPTAASVPILPSLGLGVSAGAWRIAQTQRESPTKEPLSISAYRGGSPSPPPKSAAKRIAKRSTTVDETDITSNNNTITSDDDDTNTRLKARAATSPSQKNPVVNQNSSDSTISVSSSSSSSISNNSNSSNTTTTNGGTSTTTINLNGSHKALRAQTQDAADADNETEDVESGSLSDRSPKKPEKRTLIKTKSMGSPKSKIVTDGKKKT